MTTTTTTERVKTALTSQFGRVEGVTLEDLKAVGTWNDIGRVARIQIDGVTVRVREYYDSCSGDTSFLVDLPKRPRVDPLAGLVLLTTPEEKFHD